MMMAAVASPRFGETSLRSRFDQSRPLSEEHSMVLEGAIYWYEEETIEDECEYEEEYTMESEVDFTEVTYESECPTEDDILLGTLPPAPPLAENLDLQQINDASELNLLDAMRRKRDEVPTKTTVPGTGREDPPHRNQLKQKRPPSRQHRSSAPPLEHQHSPTGVWEDLHYTQGHDVEDTKETAAPITPRIRSKTTRRVKKIDAILLRNDERRDFSLPSADHRLQFSTLQKFWRERIEHEAGAMEQQLRSMEQDMMKLESDLAQLRKGMGFD